ncbi:MAG TPA: hypothetical protein VKZ53_08025 [Candidatus Angelobacter sp.]|nr:hypothetical protein [Candidatus Angelobacter sp.]
MNNLWMNSLYRYSIVKYRFTARTRFALCLFCLYSSLAFSQDAPGRFEIGGTLAAARDVVPSSNLGPGLQADVNLTHFFALEGDVTWLPSQAFSGNSLVATFGGKVGVRKGHFGFFGVARPGLVTTSNTFRQLEFNAAGLVSNFRNDRLTERVLDLGGAIEYYVSRHWAVRWDVGDLLRFDERFPPDLMNGVVVPGSNSPAPNTNHFQFSTGIHYRF